VGRPQWRNRCSANTTAARSELQAVFAGARARDQRPAPAGLVEQPTPGRDVAHRRPSSVTNPRGHADRQPPDRSRGHDLGLAITNLRPRPAETPTLVPESEVKSLWYGLTAFMTQLPNLSRPRTSLLLMSGSFVHNPIIAGCKRLASPLPSGPHHEEADADSKSTRRTGKSPISSAHRANGGTLVADTRLRSECSTGVQ
jgi:hypothetical protein